MVLEGHMLIFQKADMHYLDCFLLLGWGGGVIKCSATVKSLVPNKASFYFFAFRLFWLPLVLLLGHILGWGKARKGEFVLSSPDLKSTITI